MTNQQEYILDRLFDAPRELVWRAWTDPDILQKWYGPGADTIIHKFDLEPGGLWLNEMKWGEKSHFQKVVFKEVTPPSKLIWHHHSSTDADWQDAPNPMMPSWPALLLTTVTFTQAGEQTNVRLSQIPIDATDEQIAGFTASMAGMGKGWGAGYAIMDDLLKEMQAQG